MIERPILFKGHMVRAILNDTKTQTRRLVKGQTLEWLQPGKFLPEFVANPGKHLCRYGYAGDRLWVRETWARRLDEDGKSIGELATNPWAWYWADPQTCNSGCNGAAGKKRPSIHMPRWASRIDLEVTEVRVERLQDITEEDAKAEGCGGHVGGQGPVSEGELHTEPGYWHPRFYRDGFEWAWNAINGKRAPWESNPWVWVITFKRIRP